MLSTRLKAAFVLFGLFTILELGDLAGLIAVIANPQPFADAAGLSRGGQLVRAIVLALLAFQIMIGSAIAFFGVWRRRWVAFRMGALFAAVGLLLYGIFQAISSIVQLNSLALALVGLIYAGLGVLSFWLGQSPAPKTSTTPNKP